MACDRLVQAIEEQQVIRLEIQNHIKKSINMKYKRKQNYLLEVGL